MLRGSRTHTTGFPMGIDDGLSSLGLLRGQGGAGGISNGSG